MPQYSKIARIAACGCEQYALCAVIKITKGKSPLVQGWSTIVPMKSKEERRSSSSRKLQQIGKAIANMVQCGKIREAADTIIRKAVADLRFTIAQEQLKAK